MFLIFSMFTQSNPHLRIVARVMLLMLIVPLCFLWNWTILRYSLRHSFDFHFILFAQVIMWVCAWALEFTYPTGSRTDLAILMCTALYVIPLGYIIEGFHLRNSRKVALLAILTLYSSCIVVTKILLRKSPADDFHDIALYVPAIDITISAQDIILLCLFNTSVFWAKKLFLSMKYPDCILLATYPQLIWIDGDRQQTLSRSSFTRQRTATMSLDIYKQTVAQEAKIYLFEKNSVSFGILSPQTADKLHSVHFSSRNWTGLWILVLIIICANTFGTFELAVICEILCVVILLIGLLTFDLEMMRFYRKSFDFWFKWYNWTVYLVGSIIWHNLESNMDGVMWTEFAFRNCALMTIICYITCIDAYHVRTALKRRALAIIVGLAVYYQICNLFQVFPLNPLKSWVDRDITIPLLHTSFSVRSIMMSGLGNFILFMGKQIVVMVRHPGAAALELFPKINWIEENNNDMETDIIPEPDMQSDVIPELQLASDVGPKLPSEVPC